MGDLRDQFKKAGLLGKKDLKRLEHEERVARKEKGRGALEREAELKREALRGKQEERRARDQETQAQANERRRRREERDRLRNLVGAHLVRDRERAVRFFFVTRAGSVPFLEVGLETQRRLESGGLAIVDLPWAEVESFALVPREVAEELAGFDPAAVRFLAGRK